MQEFASTDFPLATFWNYDWHSWAELYISNCTMEFPVTYMHVGHLYVYEKYVDVFAHSLQPRSLMLLLVVVIAVIVITKWYSALQGKTAFTNASASNGWRSSNFSPTPTNFTGILSSSTTLTWQDNNITNKYHHEVN